MHQSPSRPNRFSPFLAQDADRARLPVALLSGFLGSGKTTLVNALLRDPRMAGTAVAVNEFGAVPLDRDLIDHGRDDTVVLANGCLCCNLAGDMEEAVMRLFSRRDAGDLPRFARLVIEPSGLSDPAPIAQAILRNPLMARAMRLEAITATVDAIFGEQQLARHAETRKQVALADRLVVTKPDLAGPPAVAALCDALRRHNPAAPITVAEQGAVDPEWLFPPAFLDADAPPSRRSAFLAEPVEALPDHAARVAAVSLDTDRPLRWRPFEAWLRGIRIAHAEQLLRVKAMLWIAGTPGPVVLHGVHHVLHAPVELAAWPDAVQCSRIVLIAEAALAPALRASWTEALPGLLAD